MATATPRLIEFAGAGTIGVHIDRDDIEARAVLKARGYRWNSSKQQWTRHAPHPVPATTEQYRAAHIAEARWLIDALGFVIDTQYGAHLQREFVRWDPENECWTGPFPQEYLREWAREAQNARDERGA